MFPLGLFQDVFGPFKWVVEQLTQRAQQRDEKLTKALQAISEAALQTKLYLAAPEELEKRPTLSGR